MGGPNQHAYAKALTLSLDPEVHTPHASAAPFGAKDSAPIFGADKNRTPFTHFPADAKATKVNKWPRMQDPAYWVWARIVCTCCILRSYCGRWGQQMRSTH